jgi:hypothetical protein
VRDRPPVNSSTPPCQHQDADGGPYGIPLGPLVEAVTCSEVIYPGELPWGSARSCHMAPFTSHHPIRRPSVEASLFVCAPSPLCASPQMKVQHSVKENCHLGDMPVGLSMLLSSGPAHFEPTTVLGPCFELPSICTCGPRLQLLVIKRSVFLVSWTRLSTQLSPPLILVIINPPTSGL